MLLCDYYSIQLKKPILYEKRCYSDVPSKAYTSQINLQHGTITVENRKTKKYKRICSEVSVSSPGNPWSQSGRRKGRLRLEGFAEKESLKPGVEE